MTLPGGLRTGGHCALGCRGIREYLFIHAQTRPQPCTGLWGAGRRVGFRRPWVASNRKCKKKGCAHPAGY